MTTRVTRQGMRLTLAATLAVACRAGDAVTGADAMFERQVQQTRSRFARVHRASAGTLVVVLPENARTARTRAALEPEARFLGRGAYDSGAAAAGDAVVVEYQRVRRVGPLEFGARRTRFTFLAPPRAATAPVRL
jgi:hypothetical protein